MFDRVRGEGGSAPRPAPEADEALARRAAEDPEAFAELYRRYLPRVHAYCWSRLGSREAAEDATSQVWLNAYAALPRFRADAFRAWLFTIAHHAVTDVHRQRSRLGATALDDDLPDAAMGPELEAVAGDAGAELRRVIRLLPADQRRVVELRLAGLTGPEIRAVLGRSRPWVDTTQHRAVQRLRQLMPDASPAKEPTDASSCDPLRLLGRRSPGRTLSAYWDAVVLRTPADPVPPADVDRALAATVRRLHATPLHPEPSPSFADHLLDAVLQPHQGGNPMPATPSSPARLPLTPSVRVTSRPHAPLAERLPTAHHLAGLALAGLVAAVVVAALWLTALRGDAPDGRRDTTAVAAVGTPLPTVAPSGPPETPSGVGTAILPQGQADMFSGVLDLTGPEDRLEVWLVDLSGDDTVVIPASAYPILAMPLRDLVEETTTGTIVGAGQAFTVVAGAEARVTAQGRQPNRLLVASFGGRLLFTSTEGAVFPARHLGELAVDRSFDLGLLEVSQRTSGQANDGPIDTGRGGGAVILAEESPTAVDVLAGDAILRRSAAGGGLSEGELRIDPADSAAPSTYLDAGDVLTITGGAAFAFRSQNEAGSPVVTVTIRFDSARLDQIRRERAREGTPSPAAAPLADAGCDVTPYTADELGALLATPAAGPLPSIGFTLADGVPADARTAARIDAAADLLAVCTRTNDPLRSTTLYSEDGLRFVYAVDDLEEDLAQEVLPNDSRFTPDATVQDVRVHPDGRVSAVVDLDGKVAYVVWVEVDGVYLVELFNDAIFAGPLADGARCDAAPLDPTTAAGIVPEPLVPATPPPHEGLDISSPNEGPLLPVAPDQPGADIASDAVGRLFDCLATLDPTRIVPLATGGFRGQWLSVAADLVPLGDPGVSPATRFPLAIPSITAVETWEADGSTHVGVAVIGGSTAAYVVLAEVDGVWLVDGWAPL